MTDPGDAELERLAEIVRRGIQEPQEVRAAVAQLKSWKLESERRIAKALEFAPDSMYDGEHHKTWAIDQIVRALTGCPMVTRTAIDYRGEEYSYETQGESEEYLRFVEANEGWDEGIAP